MKVLIATHNEGKKKEFIDILGKLNYDFVTLNEFPKCEEPIEDGITIMENAILKAKYYFDLFKIPVIADDTGLFIDKLNNEPGVNSARYSGKGDAANRHKVLENLKNTESEAYFESFLVFYDGKTLITANGRLNGRIITLERGENGFGYDPIFLVPELGKTLAEIDHSKKNSISHRFKALNQLVNKINIKDENNKINYIKQYIENKFHVMPSNVEKILGGMSNDTYKVSINNKDYTFRIPGQTAELFVSRKYEIDSLELVKGNENFIQYIDFDLESGVKVSPYIIRKEETPNISKLAKALEEMHNLPNFKNDYLPFERLRYSERLNKILNANFDEEYFELRDKLFTFEEMLMSRPKVSCHNDAQLSNYIFTDNQYVLIDFEFTGNNDMYYDFACYGNDDLSIGFDVAEATLQRKLTFEDQKIIELWYALQSMTWYLVAKFKFITGMEYKPDMNFDQVATFFLNKSKNLLKKY